LSGKVNAYLDSGSPQLFTLFFPKSYQFLPQRLFRPSGSLRVITARCSRW